MATYILLGLFLGLFLGSWGGFWAAKRLTDGANISVKEFESPSRPDEPDAETPEQEQKRRVAEKAMEKAAEGLLNMLYFDGRPQKKDGEG